MRETSALSGDPLVAVAEVLIDSVRLSRVFSYAVPRRLVDLVATGCYVSVPLGARRARGWVVGVREISEQSVADLEFELASIYRVLGGGPDSEVISLCKWASWRFLGSPVHFLTHASPKRRVKASRGGDLEFSRCGESLRSPRGESVVVRITPAQSRAQWVVEHMRGLDKGQVIVVCPTEPTLEEVSIALRKAGVSVALFPDEFEKAASGEAQAVLGARNSVFATVRDLLEVIVVDADDPAHWETSSPVWSSFEVARARVSPGRKAYLLTSAPRVDFSAGSRMLALGPREERRGWPNTSVADIGNSEAHSPLITRKFLGLAHSVLEKEGLPPRRLASGLVSFDGVVVIYNRLGGAKALVCSQCSSPIRCVGCGSVLTQAGRALHSMSSDHRRDLNASSRRALRISSLVCPGCKEEYPAICTSCLGTSLKVIGFGINRFASVLQAALGHGVSEVDSSTKIAENGLSRVVVGTEAVFSRLSSAALVVIADIDQYLFSASVDAGERALSLVARCARLLEPRGSGNSGPTLLIQTRDAANEVVRAAVEGNPRRVLDEQRALLQRLGLPPFGALVRVSGPKAQQWIARVNLEEEEGVEVSKVSDGIFEVRGTGRDVLLDRIDELRTRVPPASVRFAVDPY